MTRLAPNTDTKRGVVRGQPLRFVVGHNQRRQVLKGKYKSVTRVGHPRACSDCVYEHVIVAEAALGRYLADGVEVHHVDGNGLNNTNSNLVICQDRAYHKLLHVRARVLRAGGNPNTQRICDDCKRPTLLSEFYKNRTRKDGLGHRCVECMRAYGKYRRQRALIQSARLLTDVRSLAPVEEE